MGAVVESLPKDISVGLVWIAILGLLIVYKVIDIAFSKGVERWEHRKGNGMQGTIKANTEALREVSEALASMEDPPPYPQCHYAPDHFDQVEETHRWTKEIHQMQLTQKEQIDKGVFGCRIRGPHLRTLERVEDKLNEGKAVG